MEILISRMPHVNDRQTCGYFFVLNKKKEVVYKCYCIELPDLNNAPQISRIPEGKYMVVKRNSPKFNDHFHILNVPGREYLLIHQGNFYTQIRGCILVGQDLEDINKDGILDVTQSVFTMRKLNQILPKEFSLTIQKLNAVTL